MPAADAVFWLLKILATTLGETAGDALTMTLGLGYLAGSAICGVAVALAVALQMRRRRFVPPVYWLAVVAARLPAWRCWPGAPSCSVWACSGRLSY